MEIQVVGKVVKVLPLKEGTSKSGKPYATQDYVIEMEDGGILAFNIFGKDRIERYNLSCGMKASLRLDIESTEWNGRYFTQVRCSECFVEQPAVQTTENPVPTATTEQKVNSSSDDLPF